VAAGYRSPTEVATALAACSAIVPAEFWKELRAGGLVDSDAPLPN
jgi:hypothetical protein